MAASIDFGWVRRSSRVYVVSILPLFVSDNFIKFIFDCERDGFDLFCFASIVSVCVGAGWVKSQKVYTKSIK